MQTVEFQFKILILFFFSNFFLRSNDQKTKILVLFCNNKLNGMATVYFSVILARAYTKRSRRLANNNMTFCIKYKYFHFDLILILIKYFDQFCSFSYFNFKKIELKNEKHKIPMRIPRPTSLKIQQYNKRNRSKCPELKIIFVNQLNL